MKLLLLLLMPAFVAMSPFHMRPPFEPGYTAPLDFDPVEAARVASHLARVERELILRDVSNLRPAQREARKRNIRALHEYRVRGVFPQPQRRAGARLPTLIDQHGTRSPIAWLIEKSGDGTLVQKVAATAGGARTDLADDPALDQWLDRAGLTREEAVLIDPAVAGRPPKSGAGLD
jgi:hypothetical protein